MFHQPVVVKIEKVFAPKLVAMSMGWIDKENMMSVMASAMMNTSEGEIFLSSRGLCSICLTFQYLQEIRGDKNK